MSNGQQTIQTIIDRHGGNFRTLSREVLTELATMLWFCEVRSADFQAVGGSLLSSMVWRIEAQVGKEWMKEEYKKTGHVDLDWRDPT